MSVDGDTNRAACAKHLTRCSVLMLVIRQYNGRIVLVLSTRLNILATRGSDSCVDALHEIISVTSRKKIAC